jgi:NAD(P)H dehydrogenase (quinone)
VDLALLVVAPLSSDERELRHAQAARQALAPRHVVETIDVVAEGITPAMSRTERLHYETAAPIVDAHLEIHAGMVRRANVMVFVFPTRWWTPPQVLEAWIERVFVPDVAFVLDERRRVRPHLTELRAVAGVTSHHHPDAIARAGDGARRMLIRTMRLNAPRRVRTEWLVDPAEDEIERKIGAL